MKFTFSEEIYTYITVNRHRRGKKHFTCMHIKKWQCVENHLQAEKQNNEIKKRNNRISEKISKKKGNEITRKNKKTPKSKHIQKSNTVLLDVFFQQAQFSQLLWLLKFGVVRYLALSTSVDVNCRLSIDVLFESILVF